MAEGFDGDADLDDDDDWDEENNSMLYLKYMFEGAATLGELGTALRAVADEVEQKGADGWRLVEPVIGGYADLTKAATT